VSYKSFGKGGLHLQVPKLNSDDKCITCVLRFLEGNQICVVVPPEVDLSF
jgi:hypothetical protein